jgi:uncharacterized OB-fold protein
MEAMTQDKPDFPQGYGCRSCGYRSSTFKAICPQCGSKDVGLLEKAKRGKVIESVPVFFPPDNLKDLGTYVSVLVQLENGCQMFGIVLDDPQKVHAGTPVVVTKFNRETAELFFEVA